MRYGCCGSMINPAKDPIGIEIIDSLCDLGYDYIELSLSHIAALDEKEYSELAGRVLSSGLKCEACNNFIPPSLKLTGPYVDKARIRDYVEKALYRASRLGADTVVFGSGGARAIPEGFPMDMAWYQLVDFLRLAADVAQKYGVVLAIEPLNRSECNIIHNLSDARRLSEAVNKPNVRVLADYYHFAAENDSTNNIIKAGGNISHVHFSRYKGRVFPRDITEDDYLPFITAIKKAGYNGKVSIEAYTSDFINDAREALVFLKENFY